MTQVKNSVLNQSISSLSNNIRNSSCSIASPISGAATPPASSAAGVGMVGMTLAAASLPGLLPPGLVHAVGTTSTPPEKNRTFLRAEGRGMGGGNGSARTDKNQI